MSSSGQLSLDVRAKQARARAFASAIWPVGAIPCSALMFALYDTSPAGQAMAALGGGLVVGSVIAFGLIAVNASLARDPDRVDARGAADLLCFVTGLVAVLTVMLVLVLGSPVRIAAASIAFAGLLFFALLLGMGLWTRASARPRGGAPQP